MRDGPRSLRSAAWRFGAAGVINTVITGFALTMLSLVVDPSVAYVIVFVVGIALSTYVAHRFVYGVPLGRAGTVAYVAMYLIAFAIGLAVVRTISALGLPHGATGLVVVVTAPLTFVGGRIITSSLNRYRRPHPRTLEES